MQLWAVRTASISPHTEHRVPLTDEILAILEPLKALESKVVFEGLKRHKPLSNMAMLMLLRRMKIEGITVHGFRSTFRDWASEVANAPREVAEMSLAHKVGSDVERAYARSDLLEKRRALMERWSNFVSGGTGKVVRLA
ncbi:tyrosine-type recombinase/integrase [Neptunicoccus cionae]|uniref:tyrosine-type recombinase/integrase n=1 Tax=Neptunicoccus cionae TaxID=2035344 RepID=UPI0025711BA2|nr:hypothetical protein [Amylibacter cionae]